MAKGIAVIGSSVGAAQAALTLAELGIEVKVITPSTALGLNSPIARASDTSSEDIARIWPLLLRAASHPLVTVHTNTEVRTVTGRQGKFTVRATKNPRYVHTDLCTSCGRCEEACSVKVISLLDGHRKAHSAIHAPIPGARTAPSAYYIEKGGLAPCRVACPLGINVQGFVCLISKGKVNEALSLINESAPMAGILGRVCTHPCEDSCNRGDIDSPVFIRALHRYVADHSSDNIEYRLKAPAGSRRERIAIVGSGPAGLTAAWELARRGYRPTIFESHALVGGMLATGIPRFRLPWEVRYREVEAIKALGVDIMTGVTIGRDVSFYDLMERGYRTFFLAIGAHQNNKLNIPGEELEGVVDAISLLFALNVHVGTAVGSNVVVIGGGNSAIDSARTAKRRSKGEVKILYRRTAEEMTAVKEEVEETIREGIPIEYLTTPVEILGDGRKVTGIRCQRMSLGEVEADGRRKPEPIPGSESVIEADHVVIAIGQRPNIATLNAKWLDIDETTGNIRVDPLTLETNVPGVFAAGDCVTGPNNVVDAMAAALRAAESIDRYMRRRDLRKGRTLEKPKPVEFDADEKDGSHYRRAIMPTIPPYKRKRGSFEEVDLGLPPEAADREAGRCLNCALCSECLECERACELGAVFHGDNAEQIEMGTELIIDFDPGSHPRFEKPGIYTVQNGRDSDFEKILSEASAIALEAAAKLEAKEEDLQSTRDTTTTPVIEPTGKSSGKEPSVAVEPRIGVFLCRCGGSTSEVIDFNQVINEVLQVPGIYKVQEIAQACSEDGAKWIAAQVTEWNLDKVVLAACRCCGWDQICFSCTERRVICQQNLSYSMSPLSNTIVEFVNISEQCAKVHRDHPEDATRKAIDIIMAGIARVKISLPLIRTESPVEGGALVLGAGLPGLAAARSLAIQGYSVDIVSGPETGDSGERQDHEYRAIRDSYLKQLKEQGIQVRPWPQDLSLNGPPGSYNTDLKYGSRTSKVKAGTLIVDVGELDGAYSLLTDATSGTNLLSRLLAPQRYGRTKGDTDTAKLRRFTLKESAGMFFISPDRGESPVEQVYKGTAAAARALAYLKQGNVSPRDTAVTIDSKLCRGCGECAAICPYIEMRERESGIARAHIETALCLGCGACITRCPTGAITQSVQSDVHITSTLEALLGNVPRKAGVR